MDKNFILIISPLLIGFISLLGAAFMIALVESNLSPDKIKKMSRDEIENLYQRKVRLIKGLHRKAEHEHGSLLKLEKHREENLKIWKEANPS